MNRTQLTLLGRKLLTLGDEMPQSTSYAGVLLSVRPVPDAWSRVRSKTTTVEIVEGLISPTDGAVRVLGRDPAHWIRVVAELNSVNWAVVAARAAAMQDHDWGVVATRTGLLLALLVLLALAGLIAQLTLRAYGRSL